MFLKFKSLLSLQLTIFRVFGIWVKLLKNTVSDLISVIQYWYQCFLFVILRVKFKI